MCWTNLKILCGKDNANLLNSLVQLQLLCLHNAYQFKVRHHLLPFDRNLKGVVFRSEIHNFGGQGSAVRGSGFVPSKAQPRIPNTLKYKVVLYLLPFGRN